MGDAVQIGPLMLNVQLLAVIGAAAGGMTAVRLRKNRFGEASGQVLELLMNAGFLIVLFWKFGHALFSPELIWSRPMALLLTNGSSREILIGCAAAALYVMLRLKKTGISARYFLDLLAYGATAATAIYSALVWKYGKLTELSWGIVYQQSDYRYHPLNVYMLLIALSLWVWLWRTSAEAGTGRMFKDTLLALGIGRMAVSFFDDQEPVWAYLSEDQLTGLGLISAAVIFSSVTHNRTRKEMTAMKPTKNGDSIAQREQERENGEKQAKDETVIDKKLDGPNHPST